MEDVREADGGGVGTPRRAGAGLGLLQRRDVVAALCALAGLGVGIVLGRATVPVEATSLQREGKVAQVETAPAGKKKEKADKAPLAEVPGQEYRRHLGRRLPKGDGVKGFAALELPSRKVAQLTEKEGKLRFDLDAIPGDYALSTIVYLDGSRTGTLQAHVDGQALSTVALSPGWGIYSSPVPRALLDKPEHDLTLQVDGVGDKAVVGLDSFAIVPVTADASFSFGAPAVGNLVEGFSKPSGDSVWSDGDHSTVGLVLAPEPKEYRLAVRGGALSRLAPLTVTAKVNGKDVGSGEFAKRATEATWSVPANTLVAGVNRIEFAYPSTARPTEYNPKSKDTRALALRFFNLTLQPKP